MLKTPSPTAPCLPGMLRGEQRRVPGRDVPAGRGRGPGHRAGNRRWTRTTPRRRAWRTSA
ncbi:hypothetical protein LT493_14325 [Streptomyces tricolor]|nr:hypothetical protein [Streptomyces tricolor]